MNVAREWSNENLYPHQDDFVRTLKEHLLARLHDLDYDGDERTFTAEQRNAIHLIDSDNIVEAKQLKVNYTTYDVHEDSDTIRTRRGDTIMMMSKDAEHPFWYARVIKAFHVKIRHFDNGQSSDKTMEVLWVRWLGIVPHHQWGFKNASLPKVGFVPDLPDHAPFGFLDPSWVLRASHLIPVFSEGRTQELLAPGPSLARLPGETDDWTAFYVNL